MSAAKRAADPTAGLARSGGFAGVTPGLLAGRRVLIIVENLPVPFDRRVWLEARTLQAAGAVVSVICPLGPEAQARYECLEGIHVHRHPLTQARGPAGYLREYAQALWWQGRLAWRVFRTEGFDTLQGCNPPDLIWLVALPFRLMGRAYVFDHHDLSPELFDAKYPVPSRRPGRWLHAALRRGLGLAERLSFATADMVISTNESYRRIARTRGAKGPGAVVVVRSGPDLTRVRPMPPDPRWKAGRRHLVGYVGVMGAQEGLDLLLEAARHLVFDRGRRDLQFCLAGDGPERPALEALARALGLGEHVTFAGRLPDAELFEMLSTADLCVNPDRVTAMNDLSTMNKILEYMALSRPIVQFEVTEGRVSAGDAALYARPDDPRDFAACILTLLRDPGLRMRMGAIGRRRVETRFAWEHEAGRLVEAYRRIAPRRPLRPGRRASAPPAGDDRG
ncbi:glycosyltransferase family 4 protein (plasmid) [Paroceanicella profunda]|uniref:Glycosyltransferase family 4 protein n=1 Tax=Paroceanicella profunda TaxID=2579971 RepID=A0A5B8G460_9RHOB|nr:glycosyltransferase family 4 protein [Paroceanicella profunda]QDL94800.1 glycosyltransferase family 4 protein [Paroceanicella profunda]